LRSRTFVQGRVGIVILGVGGGTVKKIALSLANGLFFPSKLRESLGLVPWPIKCRSGLL